MPDTTLYVTLTELKSWLGIDGGDEALEVCAYAASRAIDAVCNRRFYPDTTATARTFHASGSYGADVDDFYTTTGLIVKTDTAGNGGYGTTWAATDYQVEPFTPAEGWPYTRLTAVGDYTFSRTAIPFLQVTAKWGWEATPDEIRVAARIQASRIYHRRNSPQGVAGFGDLGVVRVSNRVDPDVEMLVRPYIKHPVLVA